MCSVGKAKAMSLFTRSLLLLLGATGATVAVIGAFNDSSTVVTAGLAAIALAITASLTGRISLRLFNAEATEVGPGESDISSTSTPSPAHSGGLDAE